MKPSFVIIKGQARGLQIDNMKQEAGGVWAVKFARNDTVYHYARRDVVVLTETRYFNPNDCQVYVGSQLQRAVTGITAFPQGERTHWRLTYGNGSVRDFVGGNGIEVRQNCLADENARNVFEYLKAIAGVNQLGKDQYSQGLLAWQYNSISFVDRSSSAAPYIYPQEIKVARRSAPSLVFPFGCNASQRKAVTEAFSSQLSVIQGPPGTGKTQTILNIIANALMRGKTVLVVSNNNSATANVREKLEKYGMGFIVASLGSNDNKDLFIQNQSHVPPEVGTWETDLGTRIQLSRKVKETVKGLEKVFQEQERLAGLRLELQSLRLERDHFISGREDGPDGSPPAAAGSSSIMALWLKAQTLADDVREEPAGLLGRLKERLSWWWNLRRIRRLLNVGRIDRDSLGQAVTALQGLYYQARIAEVEQGIREAEDYLKGANAKGLSEALCADSMRLLKGKLHEKYKDARPLEIHAKREIGMCAGDFCKRYPVVLSTTFSARTSVPDFMYDYIIMDEASQVSVETGALALTCARNAVIVGDVLQLPNVITDEDRASLNAIFDYYKVDSGYNSADFSFLASLCRILPDVRCTLLREHYRCHPRIINFCNQKYYGGELLIMTEDHGEKDVLSAVKTVPGHHARGHYNQREIDVIRQEVLPHIPEGSDVGIISPYNAQVDAINSQLGDISATVHKYQGREKDTIIFSVVDDEITDFSDDANLLNVAISRAKRNFCLVVTGNPQEKEGNITDLVDYIEYNNCSVRQSRIRSIFDYLYEAYTEQRLKLLAMSAKVSEYDTENLTYALIGRILKEHGEFGNLGVLCHYPLRLLISDTSLMNDEERLYASRQGTHLDFLIYSHVTKRPVLAIETDGYSYHNLQTEQHRRDVLKDGILEKYGIRLLRLSTVGSGEDREIVRALSEATSQSPTLS